MSNFEMWGRIECEKCGSEKHLFYFTQEKNVFLCEDCLQEPDENQTKLDIDEERNK